MLYEEYQNKLSRRNARIAAVWKWRYLLLAAALTLVAACIMLCLVGTVTGSSCAPTVVYGEELQLESSVIFGEATFEYRSVNGQWSNVAPTDVGSYEMRAVSHGLAGDVRYGQTNAFQILPAPLNVRFTGTALELGAEQAEFSADNLRYGDSVTVDEFTVEYADEMLKVTPVAESIKVTRGGKDVTANYNVTAQSKIVICTPLHVVATTANGSFSYDGEPHVCSETTATGLLDGHRIEATTATITDAGSIPNAVNAYKIFDEDNRDVTFCYDVQWELGTLTVDKRTAYITTANKEWTYDGTAHGYEADWTTDGLVEGHSVRLENWKKAVNVGSVDNLPQTISVTDANGDDVTGNYDFQLTCGKLTIAKRVFDVQTGNAIFVYDGTPKKYLQYDVLPSSGENEGLLSGHRVTEAASSGVTNVTDSANAIGYADNVQTYKIVDSDGKDVSANYVPHGKWGQIRVKPPIKVHVYALSKFYDGLPLAYKRTDWFVESVPMGVEKEWVHAELNGSLTEPGVLPLATLRSQSVVSVTDNGKDLLADENDPNRVDFVGTPLTINARPLTLSSISISRQNDGTPLYGNAEGAAWISAGSLLDGHNVTFNVTGVLLPTAESAQNAFTAQISDANGNDVSKYYKITYTYGTLSWI